MKGTHCGRRAVTLVFSLISLTAIAPAVAHADVIGSTAIPSTPAAPAVPTPVVPAAPVSVPATPSIPAAPVAVQAAPKKALAAPVSKAAPVSSPTASKIPVASVTVKATRHNHVSSAHVTTPVATVAAAVRPGLALTAPAKVNLVHTAAKSTKPMASPMVPSVMLMPRLAFDLPAGAKVFHAPAYGAAKSVVNKLNKKARKLQWDDDNWNRGCVNNTWQTCVKAPIEGGYLINNRCTDPTAKRSQSGTILPPPTTLPPSNGEDNVFFPTATVTTWTKVEPFTKWSNGMPTLGAKVTMKEFIRGMNGTGTASLANYKSVNDDTNTYSVFIPFSTMTPIIDQVPIAQDIWHFVQLLVGGGNWGFKPGFVAPANMWFAEHQVLRLDSDHMLVTIKWTWSLVCNKGDKPKDDQNEGCDHDRSGDQEKYKHNDHSYRGYDDDNESGYTWDQGD